MKINVSMMIFLVHYVASSKVYNSALSDIGALDSPEPILGGCTVLNMYECT